MAVSFSKPSGDSKEPSFTTCSQLFLGRHLLFRCSKGFFLLYRQSNCFVRNMLESGNDTKSSPEVRFQCLKLFLLLCENYSHLLHIRNTFHARIEKLLHLETNLSVAQHRIQGFNNSPVAYKFILYVLQENFHQQSTCHNILGFQLIFNFLRINLLHFHKNFFQFIHGKEPQDDFVSFFIFP